MVSRREVRHLGALGSAVGDRRRRLVCAEYVHRGQPAIQLSRGNLRASFEIRIQRHDSALEGRTLRTTGIDEALQESRGEVFRKHGRTPRQLRSVEFEIPAMERSRYGAQERYRGTLAQRCAR